MTGDGVSYTPASNFSGVDVFTYTISDGQAQDSATVSITVSPRPASAFSFGLAALRTNANSDGVITVGQLATVTIALTNSGQVALDSALVALTFDSAIVTPVNVWPAPDQSNAGQLNWHGLLDAGPLAPGQHAQIQVVFRALASTNALPGQVMTVQGAASGVTDVWGRVLNQKTALNSLRVTRPELTLTTAVVGSGSQAAPVGSLITFSVRLQNTGDTVITHVPLVDRFPDATLSFVRASVAGFNVSSSDGLGQVAWADLTAQMGDMAPGQQIEALLTYRLLAATPTITRQATVADARDQFGDTLPAATAATTIVHVALQLTIAATPSGAAPIAPGSVVSYEVRLTNSGGMTLTQLTVDGLLAGDGHFMPPDVQGATSDSACPVANEQEPASGRRIWSVTQLAPGGSCVIAVRTRADQVPQQGVMTFSVSAQAAQMGQPVGAQSSHTISSLPPEIESFVVITSAAGIRLEWVTQNETGLTGFHIWRGVIADRSQAVQMTHTPIPSTGVIGSSYSYSEMPPLFDTTYFYWLEVLSNQGSVNVGPLGVSLPAFGRTWLPLIQRAAP